MSDEEAPLVLQTPGGLSVSYRGRLLYSARDPSSLPRRLAAACDPEPGRLHLVPSPLLWYGVAELLSAMGPRSALLCVETDPALAALARASLPPELAGDERIAFVEASSPEQAVEAAKRLGAFRACRLTPLSGGQALDAAAYAAMAAALSSEFEASWRNRAALMMLGPLWARNIFANMAALPEIAPSPLPHFRGAAVVCGAGPSLEAALPLLARLRPTVIACDTALGTLMAAGIEPDLVVCLEGQAHNLADFTCLGSRPAALAADLSSHPATFRSVRGPKHLSAVRITPSPFLSRAEAALAKAGVPFLSLPPLGSVGVHAVHMTRLLASGPLLAAGLDFSFEAGKTHARGCPSLLAEERRLNRLTRWPGQFAVSFRDRTMALSRGAGGAADLLSDPILLSYAAILAGMGEGEGRRKGGEGDLYDLRGAGPSIGGRRISIGEAESLLRSTGSGTRDAAAGGFDPIKASVQIRAFLEDELGRLEELRLSMRGMSPLSRQAFRRLVLESDYLCWGFPDQERARELPQDFLNRLVPQVEYWARRLTQLSAGVA